MHPCHTCGKRFSRFYNMMRHRTTVHSGDMDDSERLDGSGTDAESGISDDVSVVDLTEDKTLDSDEYESESEAEEDEESVGEKSKAGLYDVWDYLRIRALKHHGVEQKFQSLKETLALNGDLSEGEVERRAMRVVLPDIRRYIYKKYRDFLLLWHYANRNKTHRRVIDTKRKLMDEEDFEPEEAIRYAVKKRRFLIQGATDTLDEFEGMDSDSDSDDDDEAHDRDDKH